MGGCAGMRGRAGFCAQVRASAHGFAPADTDLSCANRAETRFGRVLSRGRENALREAREDGVLVRACTSSSGGAACGREAGNGSLAWTGVLGTVHGGASDRTGGRDVRTVRAKMVGGAAERLACADGECSGVRGHGDGRTPSCEGSARADGAHATEMACIGTRADQA